MSAFEARSDFRSEFRLVTAVGSADAGGGADQRHRRSTPPINAGSPASACLSNRRTEEPLASGRSANESAVGGDTARDKY